MLRISLASKTEPGKPEVRQLVNSHDIELVFLVALHNNKTTTYKRSQGAQWLSGRVLDSRPKGRGFEPHRRHCVVVLEQDTFILA